jgi:hypothetical protein
VVEAIIESLKVKGDLFKFLDDKAKYVFLYTLRVKCGLMIRPDCIFATNTSSLSVTEIAASCSDARQERYVLWRIRLIVGSPVFISSIVSLMFLSTVIRADFLAVPGMTQSLWSGFQLMDSNEIGRNHQDL